ncbi:hypothetical protein ACFLVU_03535 [Chloroflexota bacterium]
MNQEFTIDEVKDVTRMARIHCPGFSEDEFEGLMELERHIGSSGYLEAVQGLIRLEEEKGISCTEALDACEELNEQKTKLEQEVPALKQRVESLVSQIKQSNTEYEQVRKALAKAGQDLAQTKSEYAAAEKKLEAFNQKMEKEKQLIGKKVEDSYQQADVTKEEVTTAGRLKAEVESHGFTLDLALDLSREFAGHKNAREKLAEGLKEHGSLNKYLDDLHNGANKERERVISEIRGLESQKKALSTESGNMRNILAQLQADVAYEEDLRHFHRRYFPLYGLLDNLSTWTQVFFMRCANPANTVAGFFDRTKGNHHFWTDKPASACPHCGYQILQFDRDIYRYLNWPEGEPLNLYLGE